MDRPISDQQKRRKRTIRILQYVLIPLGVIVCIFAVASWLNRGVDASFLKFAVVDRGEISISSAGSGAIAPLYEETIISPIDSRIVEVYRKSGDSVDVNTPILKLDLQTVENDYNKMKDEEQMKVLQLHQLKVKCESSLSELQLNIQISEMELSRQEVEWRNERHLDSIGAGTTDRVRQVELEYNVRKLRLAEQKKHYENQINLTDADIKVKELELEIYRRSMQELKRIIDEASVCAPRSAVLTYVNNVIGKKVNKGEQLATVADLKHFKVLCTISDIYSDRVNVGAPVEVRVGRDLFTGVICDVTPLSRNGVMSFSVSLDNDNDKRLRSGLKCDIQVLSAVRTDILRVQRGAFYNKPGRAYVYVRKGDRLERRQVILGESNYDYVEIVEGVREGEEIVISSYEGFSEKDNIKINTKSNN